MKAEAANFMSLVSWVVTSELVLISHCAKSSPSHRGFRESTNAGHWAGSKHNAVRVQPAHEGIHMANEVRVWDLPTRLFHWSLAACVIGLVITGSIGGGVMQWHARLGYVVLTLLLFRICWGFLGGRWSRFSSFLHSPRTVLAYARGQAHPDHLVGHNPMGSLSVLAMLAFLLAQVATGLFGDDEISFTGPLNRFVDSATGLAATWYHKQIGKWVILALVALHIAAVLFYLWKKENLIKPMLGGDKTLSGTVAPSRDDMASRMTALAVLAACGGAVAWLVQLGG
jgi:cytochrome b